MKSFALSPSLSKTEETDEPIITNCCDFYTPPISKLQQEEGIANAYLNKNLFKTNRASLRRALPPAISSAQQARVLQLMKTGREA